MRAPLPPLATAASRAAAAALAATTQSLEGQLPIGRLFTAARIARALGKRDAAVALLDEATRRLDGLRRVLRRGRKRWGLVGAWARVARRKRNALRLGVGADGPFKQDSYKY